MHLNFDCDGLHNLVPFLQLKNLKNNNGGKLILVKLQALDYNLPKVTLLHGYFSRFFFKLQKWY